MTSVRPLKVVFVCGVNRRGGPVQSVSTFAEHLTAQGHEVQVLAPGIRDTASVFTTDAGALTEIPVLKSLRGGVIAQWKIMRAIGFRRRRMTVLHANGLPELLACVPALVVLRTPCFLWFHSTSLDRSRHSAPLIRLLRRFNRLRFTAVSPTAASLLAEFDPAARQSACSRTRSTTRSSARRSSPGATAVPTSWLRERRPRGTEGRRHSRHLHPTR